MSRRVRLTITADLPDDYVHDCEKRNSSFREDVLRMLNTLPANAPWPDHVNVLPDIPRLPHPSGQAPKARRFALPPRRKPNPGQPL